MRNPTGSQESGKGHTGLERKCQISNKWHQTPLSEACLPWTQAVVKLEVAVTQWNAFFGGKDHHSTGPEGKLHNICEKLPAESPAHVTEKLHGLKWWQWGEHKAGLQQGHRPNATDKYVSIWNNFWELWTTHTALSWINFVLESNRSLGRDFFWQPLLCKISPGVITVPPKWHVQLLCELPDFLVPFSTCSLFL